MIQQMEASTEDTGEFVRLVWLIEGVRAGRDCTMNELISHAKKFFTIEDIKFRDTKTLAHECLIDYIEKVKTKP